MFGNGGGGWRLWERDASLGILQKPAIVVAAAVHGVSALQVSLRWSVQHGVSVIPKARSVDHQRENLELFGFVLSDEGMAAIDALEVGKSVYRFTDPDTFA